MATDQHWYSKWVNQEGAGRILCPACGAGFAIDIAFDNAPRWCHACKKELTEWLFSSVVLVIDPEKAPPLVKSIIDFISVLADFEAEEVMRELHHLLDRKPPTWVPPDADYTWYNKWVVAERDEGSKCPGCGASLPRHRAFDNAPRRCPGCDKELVSWDFTSVVLTIDPEKAPPLVKHIITFIRPLAACEAEGVMRTLYQLFDRKSSPLAQADELQTPSTESDVQRSREVLQKIARSQLEQHVDDLEAGRKEELMASLVRQWLAYDGHAGLLTCGKHFWFQVHPGEEGGYKGNVQTEPPRFVTDLRRANVAEKDIPELLHRLNLSQSLTCRTAGRGPIWLRVNPKERALTIEDLWRYEQGR